MEHQKTPLCNVFPDAAAVIGIRAVRDSRLAPKAWCYRLRQSGSFPSRSHLPAPSGDRPLQVPHPRPLQYNRPLQRCQRSAPKSLKIGQFQGCPSGWRRSRSAGCSPPNAFCSFAGRYSPRSIKCRSKGERGSSSGKRGLWQPTPTRSMADPAMVRARARRVLRRMSIITFYRTCGRCAGGAGRGQRRATDRPFSATTKLRIRTSTGGARARLRRGAKQRGCPPTRIPTRQPRNPPLRYDARFDQRLPLRALSCPTTGPER